LESFRKVTSHNANLAAKSAVAARFFSVINAKGGSGATTTAVNVALALQSF